MRRRQEEYNRIMDTKIENPVNGFFYTLENGEVSTFQCKLAVQVLALARFLSEFKSDD